MHLKIVSVKINRYIYKVNYVGKRCILSRVDISSQKVCIQQTVSQYAACSCEQNTDALTERLLSTRGCEIEKQNGKFWQREGHCHSAIFINNNSQTARQKLVKKYATALKKRKKKAQLMVLKEFIGS